jgi:hypothetical protein
MSFEIVDKKLMMPHKLSAIERLISANIDKLINGKRIHIQRMNVKRVMKCGEWVADNMILLHIKTKLEILSREKMLGDILNHGKFHAAYERGVVTPDGDKLIYIEYIDKSQRMELETIDIGQCMFVKNV